MNREHIEELASLIESLPYSETPEEGAFCMTDFVTGVGWSSDEVEIACGAPSCIAGWAAWLAQGRPERLALYPSGAYEDYQPVLCREAMDYLGVAEDADVRKVVLSELFRGDYGSDSNRRLSRDQAVRTLRHWGETGEIDWGVVS